MTFEEIQAQLADDVTLDQDAQDALFEAIEALEDDIERMTLIEAFIVRYPDDIDLSGLLDE